MARPLPDGAYEHPITKELDHALAGIEADRRQLGAIEDDESPGVIARHLAVEVARVLSGLGTAGRAELARGLSDRLLSELAEFARAHDQDVAPILEQSLSPPPRRLLSIHKGRPAVRPTTPLSTSTLLTRNHAEPALGRELAAELATADRVDAIVAFVTVGGVRLLDEMLESFVARGQGLRFRLLTAVFSGTTEVQAIDRLARLPGVEVRISYDVRRTRLHAKAWLFHRDTGLSTAYVGSANLTATALGGGQEWMVKVCAADLPQVIDKFEGTFDSLWQDPEFEAYDPADAGARSRLKAALGAERSSPSLLTSLVALRPLPFQEEILERLRVERELHGRRRNLLVAATGTGKTVIAACDYARVCAAAGTRPRLLFMAHRKEILIQARDTFRHALQDASFGELLADGNQPEGFEHLFATIQSVSASDLIGRLGPKHFRHVVIDECHHLPAPSYQAAVSRLTPDILLGLTATPERSDGKSLLPDFDGHVAHELRLWQALDQQLLVPFEYFGISDSTDLRSIRWSRTGYDLAALSNLYTAHDTRAALVLAQLARRVADVRLVRALGFCVSIEHARFMATQFQRAGIPALAVHGDSSAEERSQAANRLRDREVLFQARIEGTIAPIMTKIPTGRFVWFDYVSSEADKAQAFFGELFRWKTKDAPMPGGRTYTMIALGEATIGGYTQPPPDAHWLSYLQVADAHATAAMVTSMGGTVTKPPFAVGPVATMALVVDPLGAPFALWQPNQVQDTGDYKGTDGAWIWNELYSDDPDRSVAFYKAIGGFEVEKMKMGGGGPGPDRYEILKFDGKGRAGVMKRPGVPPHWMPYVKVADTDATVEKAKKLGAEVKNVETVPGVGRLAVFIDPLGAPLGILQPEPM